MKQNEEQECIKRVNDLSLKGLVAACDKSTNVKVCVLREWKKMYILSGQIIIIMMVSN